MISPRPRRCAQCTRCFVPDPRVGERQVTCGATECQRRLHARRCQQWRARHRDASRHHYEDVIKPFRAAQPTYQRRWRLGRRLVEIREHLSRLTAAAKAHLDAAAERARALLEPGEEVAQSGVITGNSLPDIVAAIHELTAALGRVEAQSARLAALGV